MPSDNAQIPLSEIGRLWSQRADDWAEIMEENFRPVYEAVVARSAIGPGTRYLDIGCGAGRAAQLAASRGAKVFGIDAAEGLLVIARKRTPNGTFEVGGIDALPYADGSFDVVSGINAFQFARDPTGAIAEARRVTKPGGIVAIVTWSDPEGMEAARLSRSIRDLLPPPAPGAPAGPLALSDERSVRQAAQGVGLGITDVFEIDSPFRFRDEEHAAHGLSASGVARRAVEQSGETAVRAAHFSVITPFRQPDGRYVIQARFRCVLARRET